MGSDCTTKLASVSVRRKKDYLINGTEEISSLYREELDWIPTSYYIQKYNPNI